MLDQLAEALRDKNITLNYKLEAVALIAHESYSAKYGARNMRRYIQNHVEDKLAELLIADYSRSYTQALISAQDGQLKITCM